jgi:Plasmid pRiA4b ORF-3-like protein
MPKNGKPKGSKPGTAELETVEANMAAAKPAAKTAKPKSAKPAAAQATAADAIIISLKVSLNRIKPPIWRRLLVPTGMSLGHLHLTLQSAMGWEDCHLHAFDIGGRQ